MDHERNTGNTTFFERAQHVNLQRVEKLRDTIIKNASQQTSENSIIKLRKFHIYTISLPPLRTFPLEFQQLFTDALIDIDMKDDLERSEVINWCRTAKKLYPLRTTGDGNCLLHAVSQYLWGIEDGDLFLRRMLYLNIATDPRGTFKRRWLSNQRNAPEYQRFDLRLNTEEFTTEWDIVLKATADIAHAGTHGLPFTALESIHLYILANMLQRPIIVLADGLARNVYGQTMQECHIGGIYLPLDSRPADCCKTPIVIGYNMNHFAPLICEEDGRSGQPCDLEQVVPIVTKEFDSLPVRYLLPNEEPEVASILQQYLVLKEVITSRGNILSVTSVKLVHQPLPDDLNIMDAYRVDCERKFREMMDREAGYNPHENKVLNEHPVQPFHFQVAERPINVPPTDQQRMVIRPTTPAGINVQEPMVLGEQEYLNERRKCVTVGCDMYGNPEMSNLCTRCFKDFTIQYNRQEQAAKRTQHQQPQPLPVNPKQPRNNVGRPQEETRYHDLSMMGEDCHAGCGFKCSTETYPYCHECHPKFGGGQRVPQPQQRPPQQQVEFSIMPETCHGQNCTYKCSKRTYPYCHECYNKQPRQAPPTAPPQSVPIEAGFGAVAQPQGVDPNLVLRIGRHSDETALLNIQPTTSSRRQTQVGHQETNQASYPVPRQDQTMKNIPVAQPTTEPMVIQSYSGERARKCKTEGCVNNAIKGNDGTCDSCYQNSLFGAGNNASSSPPDENVLKIIENLSNIQVCATPACTATVSCPGTTLCLECFLKGGNMPVSSSNVPTPGMSGSQAVAMNISPSEGDEKILNSGRRIHRSMNVGGPPLTGSMRLTPSQHDETTEAVYSPAVLRLQSEEHAKYQAESGTYRKYICSTPGCQGTRTDNPAGLCYTCLKSHESSSSRSSGAAKIAGSNLEVSENFMSGSPVVLSEQEVKELNPVVVSSRQKQKCASPACETMIYPPKKLCDECSAVLEKARAITSKEKINSVPESTGLCKTPGCQFFGAVEFKGYCSSCSKGKARLIQRLSTTPEKPEKRHTAPLTAPLTAGSGKHSGRHTAPLVAAPLTAGLGKHSGRHTAPLVASSGKQSGEHCIEKGCSRFGDPSQGKRCSMHYQQAMERFPPMSPVSLQNLNYQHQPAGNLITNQNAAGAAATGSEFKNRLQNVCTNQNVPVGRNLANEETQVDPLFFTAMSKVEALRKSHKLCKNSKTTGCSNFGNVNKNGYCNTCYPELERQELQRKKILAGQNQFG